MVLFSAIFLLPPSRNEPVSFPAYRGAMPGGFAIWNVGFWVGSRQTALEHRMPVISQSANGEPPMVREGPLVA